MRRLLEILIGWAFFVALFAVGGVDCFGFMEQMGTFVGDWAEVSQQTMQTGGLAEVIALFLTQFFVNSWAGAIITALILALSSEAIAAVLRRVANCDQLAPLALLPTTALAMLVYNVNFLYSGIVAFALMSLMLALTLLVSDQSRYARLIWALLTATLLYATAGAIAMLYAVVLLLIDIRRHPKQAYLLVLAVVWVYVLAYFSVKMGAFGEMKIALMPAAYFTHRLQAPSAIWLPWTLMGAVVVIGCALGWLAPKPGFKLRVTYFVIGAVAAIAYALVGSIGVNTVNQQFKRLHLQVAAHDWDAAIETANRYGQGNVLFQNALNLALAETGQLGEKLFDAPCIDIRSIYQQGDKTPYISMLMSDVYFSMGHISQAQRYAFEANQMLGNHSPRMLQRLVQTNIVYGRYDVAAKYLRLLDKTINYKDWAEDYAKFLHNDDAVNADSLLGSKRRCLFPDNRFAAIKGLDDDLKQIAIANPDHKPTREYLGSLYLLSKDLPRFKQTVDSFYVGERLPRAFQEGILLAIGENIDSVKAVYDIDEATIQRLADFKASPSRNKNTFWYFYRYVN